MSERSPSRLPLDALLMGAVARRLDRELAGRRLQKVYEPEAGTLVLHLHPAPGDRPLLLRTRSGGFVGPAEPGLANPAEPSAFCMLLRKHLEGGFVRAVRQLDGDRVLTLEVERKDEGGELRRLRLVMELLGTRTNFHLVEGEDRLLRSARRYPTDRSRLADGRYRTPERRQPEVDPVAASPEELQKVLVEHREDPRALGRRLGLSPVLADLAAACEGTEAGRGVALLGRLLDPANADAGPFLVLERGGKLLALAGGLEDHEREGARVERYEGLWSLLAEGCLGRVQREREERSRREARRALGEARKRVERKLERNRTGLEECDRAGELERMGELLKRSLGQIRRGVDRVGVTDYASGEPEEVEVPLDPRKPPRANLDRYFQRAKRLKAKRPVLERKRRHLEEDLRTLDELEDRLERVESSEEDGSALDLKEELRHLGLLGEERRATGKSGKPAPARGRKGKPRLRTFVSSDGLRILVGRSNQENDYLVRKAGKKGDTWLHAEGTTGAYVLVKLPGAGSRPPRRTLEEAAKLAAHFSRARWETKARVMVADVGKVRRPANAPPGVVTLDHHDTLVVTPEPGIVRRLAPVAG